MGKVCLCLRSRLASSSRSQSSPLPRLNRALTLLTLSSFVFALIVLPLILPLTSSSPRLTLLIQLAATAVLCSSNAYFQSAVFALAALWGSQETLAVMSGQGGIAVLVAGTQLVIALGTLKHSSSDTDAAPSRIAGTALWLLGSLAMLGCFYCLKVLERKPELHAILDQAHLEGPESTSHGGLRITKRVAKKNWRLNFAVAWVFVVCLVRPKHSLRCSS